MRTALRPLLLSVKHYSYAALKREMTKSRPCYNALCSGCHKAIYPRGLGTRRRFLLQTCRPSGGFLTFDFQYGVGSGSRLNQELSLLEHLLRRLLRSIWRVTVFAEDFLDLQPDAGPDALA